MKVVEKSFRENELKGSIAKFDFLLEEVTLGLSKNPTVTRDALFLWVAKTNKRGLEALKKPSVDALNEIVPTKKLDPLSLKRHNLKKTFGIQEGAASGKSICTHFLVFNL